MSSADTYTNGTTPARVPAVTVLIPAYNAGAFLREAVDSILAQTFTDFECLVMDDGSTDGAVDALREIADPRLRIERNPHNLGLIATLNRGLELARAPLLARMDADDVALPTRFDRQVATFRERPHLALLGTCATMIDEHGVEFDLVNVPLARQDIVENILKHNVFVHPSVMMRTAIARLLGGYPANAPQAEDYALWLRFALQYEVENLAERLVLYRMHSGQVSQRKMAEQRRTVQLLQQEAWIAYKKAGLVTGDMEALSKGRWAQLRARPGTLGADYLAWAWRYRKMGNRKGTIKTALTGLSIAPLSLALMEVCLPLRLCPTYWFALLRGAIHRIPPGYGSSGKD
jgi:hypothetical protein